VAFFSKELDRVSGSRCRNTFIVDLGACAASQSDNGDAAACAQDRNNRSSQAFMMIHRLNVRAVYIEVVEK
jgi:hypothetical protein